VLTLVVFLQCAVKQCLVLTISEFSSGTSFHKVCTWVEGGCEQGTEVNRYVITRQEVTEDWKTLHSNEIHNLYCVQIMLA
jgi:hypothetical protein